MRTTRTAALPRFYAQPIGSLPRPKVVIDLLGRRDRAAMDNAVRFAIRLQETAGLDVVSDGEWRRTQYVDEFLDRIGGFERSRRFEHAGEVKFTRVMVRRISAGEPVFAGDAQFLASNTARVSKFALPSPFLIAIRYWHEDYSRDAYPTYRHLLDHLAEILTGEARAAVEAGIDVVQVDDPALTYFCDRSLMAGEGTHDERLRREWNPERQIPEAIDAINRVVEGLKAEVHLHCCHSVYKRRSDVSGDYKPLLPYLRSLRADRVNLEFAYQDTGDVTDLRFLPEHLGVGMGVVDVRGERLQSVEEIAALAAAGAEIVGSDRIALNPDWLWCKRDQESARMDRCHDSYRSKSCSKGGTLIERSWFCVSGGI